jgi:ribose/xylose/arabinose/galactoside ABC-type transport system permease subunit
MAAISPTASSPSVFERVKGWLRTSRIPPVYGILVIIFITSIFLDAFFGIDNELFIFNQTIMTNMLIRSVALGIVAVGQTFVMIGASIDLSVAFTISLSRPLALPI